MQNLPRASNHRDGRQKAVQNPILIREVDPYLFGAIVILVLFGLVMVLSASYYSAGIYRQNVFFFATKQAVAAILGLLVMGVISLIDYRHPLIKVGAPFFYVVTTGLVLYTSFFGVVRNGARRWLDIPILGSVQPSEFAKLGLILFLAILISNMPKKLTAKSRFFYFAFHCTIVLIPTAFVFLGNNLSTAIIMAAIGFGMIFIASPYFWRYVLAAGFVVGAGITKLVTSDGFRGDRFRVWFDPFSDPMNKGFQTIQSLFAVASGGLFGLGLGQSRQKLIYMPEPHNDFIFAIICEELGFFGAMLLIILFGVLVWRGVKAALCAPDLYGTLVATGAVVLVATQVIINVSVVTNTFPNTGIPMPFISYGGTSLISVLMLMGFLLNISRHQRR